MYPKIWLKYSMHATKPCSARSLPEYFANFGGSTHQSRAEVLYWNQHIPSPSTLLEPRSIIDAFNYLQGSVGIRIPRNESDSYSNATDLHEARWIGLQNPHISSQVSQKKPWFSSAPVGCGRRPPGHQPSASPFPPATAGFPLGSSAAHGSDSHCAARTLGTWKDGGSKLSHPSHPDILQVGVKRIPLITYIHSYRML